MDTVTSPMMPRLHLTPDEAHRVPVQEGRLSALLLSHGSLEVRWYAPHGTDPQLPHDRDEIYVVVSGTATFLRAEQQIPFGEEHDTGLAAEERVEARAGDVLFVPAGTLHRFEVISDDFGAWMMFYGPEGGERP